MLQFCFLAVPWEFRIYYRIKKNHYFHRNLFSTFPETHIIAREIRCGCLTQEFGYVISTVKGFDDHYKETNSSGLDPHSALTDWNQMPVVFNIRSCTVVPLELKDLKGNPNVIILLVLPLCSAVALATHGSLQKLEVF